MRNIFKILIKIKIVFGRLITLIFFLEKRDIMNQTIQEISSSATIIETNEIEESAVCSFFILFVRNNFLFKFMKIPLYIDSFSCHRPFLNIW